MLNISKNMKERITEKVFSRDDYTAKSLICLNNRLQQYCPSPSVHITYVIVFIEVDNIYMYNNISHFEMSFTTLSSNVKNCEQRELKLMIVHVKFPMASTQRNSCLTWPCG